MPLVIDIETENTGSDVMNDNRRIISIQIGDDTIQELYYADSRDPEHTLEEAKRRIESLLSQGQVFAGFNIKDFDIPLLKRFLGIEIPEANMIELSETPRVAELKSQRKFGLEEVCKECGVQVSHKQRMNEKAEKYRKRQDIEELARIQATKDVQNKGWGYDFSYSRALDKTAGGHAIYDAYLEFVRNGGQKNSLFYEYAIGDVVAEYRLSRKLR